jgi:hypothetical protein
MWVAAIEEKEKLESARPLKMLQLVLSPQQPEDYLSSVRSNVIPTEKNSPSPASMTSDTLQP